MVRGKKGERERIIIIRNGAKTMLNFYSETTCTVMKILMGSGCSV
jgi:site-specific recombinase XerD